MKKRKLLLSARMACTGNLEPDGYDSALLNGNNRKEFSGGHRQTTNNSAELKPAIVSLEALKSLAKSDSLVISNMLWTP